MTTPPGGQYPPQPPHYPQQQYPPPRYYQQGPPPGGGRKALPWLVGGAVVVVAALVVTLVLTLGGDDEKASGKGGTPADSDESRQEYDLSTPEKAAESFAAAAASGDGQQLLELACVNYDGCLEQLQEQPTDAELEEGKQLIINGVDELAEQLEGAEFGEATEASIPNGREVPYRTPTMGDDEYRAFMFLEFEGDWLWAGSAGGGSGGGGGGAGPPTT